MSRCYIEDFIKPLLENKRERNCCKSVERESSLQILESNLLEVTDWLVVLVIDVLREEAKDDIVQEKKPRLEGQALLELRQRLRQRKKMFKLMPDFRLKPIGLDARLEIASDLRKRLSMKDLQNLLLYSILGSHAPVEPARLVNKDTYFCNLVQIYLCSTQS